MTLSELKQRFSRIKGICADDTWFIAQAMMYLVENLSIKTKGEKPRKINAWSIFLGKYLKEGKTIKEAAIDWKGRK